MKRIFKYELIVADHSKPVSYTPLKKGLTDKEIAYAIGILPQTFCEKKSE